MDIVASPRKYFDALYENMISPKGFQQFADITGCILGDYADYASTIQKALATKKVECQPLCVPQNFEKYMDSVISFGYYKNINEKDIQIVPAAVAQKKFRQFIDQNAFRLQVFLQPGDSDDISSLYLNEVEKGFKPQIGKLNTNNEYFFAINLGVVTGEEHGVSLIVHKLGSIIEYIFADSEGYLFNDKGFKAGLNYPLALDKIVKFINDPEYLDSCILKYNVFIEEQYNSETQEEEEFSDIDFE